MLRRIQHLNRGQRIVVFMLFIGGGLLALLALTAGLALITLNSGGRGQAVSLKDGVTVREFAVLPDNDAYPAAVAVGPDGVVYTGSFVTGAIWSIDSSGRITELPGTRDAVGSVAGLALAADGTLYVVDQEDADPLTTGGLIRRIAPNGEIADFATIDDERGFVLPDDAALDAEGNIYVTDRGRAEVWRFDESGKGHLWWSAPPAEGQIRPAPTGLAYDAGNDALIVSDGNLDIIYRVFANGSSEILYNHAGREFPPGFDGVTVTPDGVVYVAALSQNGIVALNGDELEYTAGSFRGASDVDYFDNQLYVTNFDSFSLVVPAVGPRLPFALDVITFPKTN